ncbi:hypothetical protein LINPERPRIM_LOCUS28114 [Linum perenne]
MPITFVGYKPTISSSGRLLGHHRSRLHFTLLEAIICTRSWIKDDIKRGNLFHFMSLYLYVYFILFLFKL